MRCEKGGFGVCFVGRTGLRKTHVQCDNAQDMLMLGCMASQRTQECPKDGKTSLKKLQKKLVVSSVILCNKS